jgi:hypothetical protein
MRVPEKKLEQAKDPIKGHPDAINVPLKNDSFIKDG